MKNLIKRISSSYESRLLKSESDRISDIFKDIDVFCNKLDSISKDLESLLNDVHGLDKKLSKFSSIPAFSLKSRLKFSLIRGTIGSAFNGLSKLNQILRSSSPVIRKAIMDEISSSLEESSKKDEDTSRRRASRSEAG